MIPKAANTEQRAASRYQLFAVISSLFALRCPLSHAANRCTPEADYMVSQAAECLEHADIGCAKLRLDPILEKEPNCGRALFVRGWITQYDDGEASKGRAMQDKAMKLDPSLGEFWEQRGHAIEAGLTSEAFSHFDLQFYGSEDRDKAWDAVKYLNEMYGHLGSIFGIFPPKRIPVIVFTTEEFLDAWRAPFIGGFYDKRDGKIRVRVDEVPGGDEEFRHRARHELTHAFLYQIYPHDLPSWVSEGVAEFYARSGSAEPFWKEYRLEEIRKELFKPTILLYEDRSWLTLEKIQVLIARKDAAPYAIQRAYLESEALVLWIAKERAESWFVSVLEYLRQHGGTFEAAYQAVMSESPSEAMERLRHAWE